MEGFLCLSCAGSGPPVFRSEPREVVLDRYAGHTAICPDSMRAYRAFRTARGLLGVATALAASALASTAALAASGGAADSSLLLWCEHVHDCRHVHAKRTTSCIFRKDARTDRL